MSKRTVLNESYKGLVEAMSIPAEIQENNGKKYASFGSTVPIHSCTPEKVAEFAKVTHHYCDVFTEQVMAPLGELAYVRIDESTAEKVFINRSKRILLLSSDGHLAQWRCAPSFESANIYMAGTPIVNKDGELVSIVTAKRGNHYAVSTFEGEGGYFETPQPWKVVEDSNAAAMYGDRTFSSRDALREHIAALPPALLDPAHPPAPCLHLSHSHSPRISLVASNGRQIAYHYLHAVIANNVEYL